MVGQIIFHYQILAWLGASASDAIAGILTFAFVAVVWVTPVVLGVRWARRKGVSPHWMWFGLHPLSGWIAFLVIRYRVKSSICASCGKSVPQTARFCPHCQAPTEVAERQFRWSRNEAACSKCRAWVKLNGGFCPSCSTPAPKLVCSLCGSANTTLVGGRKARVAGIWALVTAGSFLTLFDRSTRSSYVYYYSKQMTVEMVLYLACGVVFILVGGYWMVGSFGTLFKKVSCTRCGRHTPLSPTPQLSDAPLDTSAKRS